MSNFVDFKLGSIEMKSRAYPHAFAVPEHKVRVSLFGICNI